MNLFGFEISVRRKAAVSSLTSQDIPSLAGLSRGWWPLVRESSPGAWQRGQTTLAADALTHVTAWACITLIAFDIAKMPLCLKRRTSDGIWEETDNPAYSPVLRRPNHYQNRIQFIQSWLISLLTRGTTYVLKERDARGVVVGLYVLDPARVQVLVAPDGQVYYHCSPDEVTGIAAVTVPAHEIIHDVYIAPYHPLIGVSPVLACGMAIGHGLQILSNLNEFFQNGSNPGGVLTAPNQISNENAQRIQAWWESNFGGQQNVGKVAVLGDGLKFERMGLTAVEAEVIKQLNWDDEKICSAYHVPGYKVGVGPMPTYNGAEAGNQQYYSQCLQHRIEAIELLLDEGLRLPADISVEFDVEEGLLRMDSATKMKVVTDGIKGMVLTPNEGRKKYGLRPVEGGNELYGQEQDHSLRWLATRDAQPLPSAAVPVVPATAPAPEPDEPDDPAEPDEDDTLMDDKAVGDVLRKALGMVA